MTAARPVITGTFCALLITAIACDKQPVATTPPIKKLPTTQVILAGRPFTLEVAIDPKDMERGLMYRTSMGADEGMIFIFPQTQQLNFYMKNTELPLDIAYLDESGTVLNIPKMYPHDLTSVPSRGPAKYAIELNQGTADRIGLHPGDHVELPASLR